MQLPARRKRLQAAARRKRKTCWSARGRRSSGPVNHSSRPKTKLIRSPRKRIRKKRLTAIPQTQGKTSAATRTARGIFSAPIRSTKPATMPRGRSTSTAPKQRSSRRARCLNWAASNIRPAHTTRAAPFWAKRIRCCPGLAIYGDWRTALAYNRNNGKDIAQIATRLNLDVDFKITGTERIHAFFTPLQKNNQFTRFEFGGRRRQTGSSISSSTPSRRPCFSRVTSARSIPGSPGKKPVSTCLSLSVFSRCSCRTASGRTTQSLAAR